MFTCVSEMFLYQLMYFIMFVIHKIYHIRHCRLYSYYLLVNKNTHCGIIYFLLDYDILILKYLEFVSTTDFSYFQTCASRLIWRKNIYAKKKYIIFIAQREESSNAKYFQKDKVISFRALGHKKLHQNNPEIINSNTILWFLIHFFYFIHTNWMEAKKLMFLLHIFHASTHYIYSIQWRQHQSYNTNDINIFNSQWVFKRIYGLQMNFSRVLVICL